MLIFTKITVDEELVFVVIENVVFVFVDDVHRAKDVQGIVNSSLNILKIDSLPFLHIKMISFWQKMHKDWVNLISVYPLIEMRFYIVFIL